MSSRASGRRGGVLVTEGEHRGVLAACRALADAGCDVVVVSGRRPAAAHWSRACRTAISIADPGERPRAFLAELERVLEGGRTDLLIAGGERSLLPISGKRESLERHVAIGLPEHESVLRSLDKFALLDAARAAGLDPPESVACNDASDVEVALRRLRLPLVVKPRRSVAQSSGQLLQRSVRVVLAEVDLQPAIADVGLPAIVQSFERHARRLSTAGVMTDDGLLGFVAMEFIRTWPPEAGAVSFGETVSPPKGLEDRVAGLLASLGWRGLFELELLELEGGRYAAIDLNPRIFGWLGLAVAAGANLPRLWIDWLGGRTPDRVTPRIGVRFRWEEADMAHLLWQLRRVRLRQAAAVMRPKSRVVHAHFRARDPAPLVARALELTHRRFAFR